VVDANITSEANTGGKLRIVCSAAHGLVDGDIVTVHGMNNAGHNGVSVVLLDATNPTTEFIANSISYVAGAGASAGSVYAPAYLECGASSGGTYFAGFCLDGTAANINKNWKWELNVGLTEKDNVCTERNSTATLAAQSTFGPIVVAAGERVWISGKNVTDTTDYITKNMSLSLHRLG
jgi:hypothetical protein